MPRCIVKIKDKYFEYSTVVDGLVTYGMTLEEFEEYYRHEYGEQGMLDYPNRMARVEKKGTSSMMDDSMEEVVDSNRSGKNYSALTPEQLYMMYQDAESEEKYEKIGFD